MEGNNVFFEWREIIYETSFVWGTPGIDYTWTNQFFVMFINEFLQGLNSETNLALYADDTKLWRSIKNEFNQ